MKVQDYVTTTAEVRRVTELSVGDAYKRIEVPSYGGSASIVFGVITSMMNNGEVSGFMAIEISGIEARLPVTKIRTFAADSELNLFPATSDEIDQFSRDILEIVQKELSDLDERRLRLQEKSAHITSVLQMLPGHDLPVFPLISN